MNIIDIHKVKWNCLTASKQVARPTSNVVRRKNPTVQIRVAIKIYSFNSLDSRKQTSKQKKQANKQTSKQKKQANKQTSKQANKQKKTSKQASKQASKKSKQTSKQAKKKSKQTSKQKKQASKQTKKASKQANKQKKTSKQASKIIFDSQLFFFSIKLSKQQEHKIAIKHKSRS